MTTNPTLLRAPERLLDLTDKVITTSTAIDAGEPCFAGHYPAAPILPGVLLIEIVNRAVHRYAADRLGRCARLHTLDSVRFFALVGPGDSVTTACQISTCGDLIDVTAECRAGRVRASTLRARYSLE